MDRIAPAGFFRNGYRASDCWRASAAGDTSARAQSPPGAGHYRSGGVLAARLSAGSQRVEPPLPAPRLARRPSAFLARVTMTGYQSGEASTAWFVVSLVCPLPFAFIT